MRDNESAKLKAEIVDITLYVDEATLTRTKMLAERRYGLVYYYYKAVVLVGQQASLNF
jgi:hypothetical protein